MTNLGETKSFSRLIAGIFDAAVKLNRISEDLLSHSEYTLSGTALSIMISIRRAETMLTVPQIAEKYWVSRQAIQRQIQILLNEAIVEKHINPNHRRSVHYGLTAKGDKILDDIIHNVFDPWLSSLIKKCDDVEIATTVKVLTEITHS